MFTHSHVSEHRLGIILLAAFSLLLLCAPTAAQHASLDEETRSRIDEVFDFVKRDEPGCAIGVFQRGRVAYAQGYGLANLDWGVPISPSTVFDIGSVSKQFTAAAVALLDIDGVLSLDDDVREWIPELPDYGQPITIRHLLNHTSGIRDYLTLMTLAGHEYDNVFDELAGVDLVVKQQGLNFPPGSEYLYSNSGYLLLANIVRRASGDSLRVFLEKRVFEPLGMNHTTIWDDNSEILRERATGYASNEGRWSIDHAWNFQMGGDGQVITSVEDFASWDANFDDPTVGGEALLDRLVTQGVLDDGEQISYALGLTVDTYRGLERIQHGGSWAGFRAFYSRFPAQRTSFVVLCNRADASTATYNDAMADIVLAGQLEPPDAEAETSSVETTTSREPVDLKRDQLARWQGVYRQEGEPMVLTVELRADGLFGSAMGQTFRLEPYSETEFELAGVALPVAFSETEGVATISLQGRTLTRVAIEEPRPEELSLLAGRYHSPELGVSYDVVLEAGKLVLHRPNADPAAFLFLGSGEMSAGGLGVELVREDGRVIGMRLNAGRVKGIEFTRE